MTRARLKRWGYASLVAIAASELLAPQLVHVEPAHFWFEDLPAWGSLYGLASCVAIIVVSKLLGKAWLSRPGDYYER